jgi:hypothetical protein
VTDDEREETYFKHAILLQREFSVVPHRIDTQALGMALDLADLLEWVDFPGPFRIQSKIAGWLRAEVKKELLS